MVYTDKYASIEHLTVDSGNANKEGYTATSGLQGVSCNIQPTAPEVVALYGGAYGKEYTMYTTVSGIRETDRVTVSGTGETFIVKGKQSFDYQPLIHSEYRLEKIL